MHHEPCTNHAYRISCNHKQSSRRHQWRNKRTIIETSKPAKRNTFREIENGMAKEPRHRISSYQPKQANEEAASIESENKQNGSNVKKISSTQQKKQLS
jgi:hypothetical protein